MSNDFPRMTKNRLINIISELRANNDELDKRFIDVSLQRDDAYRAAHRVRQELDSERSKSADVAMVDKAQIQGLNRKISELQAEVKSLRESNGTLAEENQRYRDEAHAHYLEFDRLQQSKYMLKRAFELYIEAMTKGSN